MSSDVHGDADEQLFASLGITAQAQEHVEQSVIDQVCCSTFELQALPYFASYQLQQVMCCVLLCRLLQPQPLRMQQGLPQLKMVRTDCTRSG